MKTYLVGGAVRDKLLGRAVAERDWVVVGAAPEDMEQQGFKQVGSSFPVFLHPQTKEEYALARTERKTGPGYQGFSVDFSPEVSLEDDLRRRDLTINAMAEDDNGQLIDPFGGRKDLEAKQLRHVSPAFIEDPVRVLRVARFHARFAGDGFEVAPETKDLMRRIVDDGEIDYLVPERVWQEMHKALSTDQPWRFFDTLDECGALARLVPETSGAVDRCREALIRACRLTEEPPVRFAAWAAGTDRGERICERLKTPNDARQLVGLTQKLLAFFIDSTQLPPPDILEGLKSADAFRRPERFERFLIAAEALASADAGDPERPFPQREYLHTALMQAAAITAKDLTKVRLEGKALAEELDIHRRAAISKIKRTYRWAKFH